MALVGCTHHSASREGMIDTHCTAEMSTAPSFSPAGAQYFSMDLDDALAAVRPDTVCEPQGPLVWTGAPSLPGAGLGTQPPNIDALLLDVSVFQMTEDDLLLANVFLCWLTGNSGAGDLSGNSNTPHTQRHTDAHRDTQTRTRAMLAHVVNAEVFFAAWVRLPQPYLPSLHT